MEILISEMGRNVTVLGSNCGASSLKNHIISEYTQMFDYVGCSIRGVVEALDNNFKGCFHLIKLNETDKYESYNARYRFHFFHDGPSEDLNYSDFLSKKRRQIARFKDGILTSTIFIRVESKIYCKNSDEEIFWLKEFKKRINRENFVILFFSYDKGNYYDENIIVLKINDELIWPYSGSKLLEIVNNNEQLINNYFEKNSKN